MTETERWPDLAGRLEEGRHRLAVRVYYEDTDFSGFVYHANYLKFCERARSDCLRLLGIQHHALSAADGPGLGFVVSRLEAEFLKPAVIDDVVEVVSAVTATGRARIVLDQRVERGRALLFRATVTVALVDRTGRPQRLPAGMAAALAPVTRRP